MPAQCPLCKYTKKASDATFITTVAARVQRRISLPAQTVGRLKYQKKIASRNCMDAATNTLVAIRNIIAATDVKAKIRRNSFGHSVNPCQKTKHDKLEEIC